VSVALLGLAFGLIFAPIAVAWGERLRLAMAAEGDPRGAAAVRAAIVIGRVGIAIHLTLAMTALPWVLFMMPLMDA
jgi:hypothetical protein